MKGNVMKNKKKGQAVKEIPIFKNEDEEREFWAAHDSTEYVDWSKAEEASFPNLKPTTQSISIRLPLGLLNDLKTIANQMDVPYQSLMKIFLSDKVKEKFHSAT
jgi:predicted DNA binding CopG/RHH family protein